MSATRADRLRYERVLQRLIQIKRIEEGEYLPYVTLTMPVPEDPEDIARSLYEIQRFHKVLAVALEEVAQGKIKRLIVSWPPRHGKTELASKRFIPFYAGRNPGKSVIFGTYNDKFSMDIGRAVREIIQHPASRQAFPDLVLKDDSAASDRLETIHGGVLAFVGRGGTTTGRGADLFVIDDPFKDAIEADSETLRETVWTWFNRVASTRMMTQEGAIVIIGTRWHPDDIIGRLTDPANDHYDVEEARHWRIINLPALALPADPLGRKEGEALWPSRFGVDFLHSIRRRDPRGFSALYQGRPNPDSGNYFEEKWLRTYEPNELPERLRIYAASDHAVSLTKGSDKTCLMVVGVDEDDTIWVLGDTVWRMMHAEHAVDSMLLLMRMHHPMFWWAEKSHISKSLGPFLRKRMLEEQVYCTIIEVQPISDKETRAQSIQGRMSSGKVRWPRRAAWWPSARDELLAFPHGAHDDLCMTGDTPILMANGAETPIRDVQPGDDVTTPDGPRRVLAATLTQSAAPVFRVHLSNGRSLTATANHPVWVHGKGFVRVDALAYMDELWHSAERVKPKWWSMAATAIDGIRKVSTDTFASISTQQSRVAGIFIAISGRIRSVPFLPDMTFITSTATITTSETSNACPSKSIGGTTWRRVAERPSIWRCSTQSGRSRLSGMAPQKGLLGTVNTGAKPGSAVIPWLKAAFAAASRLARAARGLPGIVGKRAVRVLSVEALTTPQPVYNLTVHGSPVYFAAGVLAHNCDAIAYIGLGLQSQRGASMGKFTPRTKIGTFGWLKEQRARAERAARASADGGW